MITYFLLSFIVRVRHGTNGMGVFTTKSLLVGVCSAVLFLFMRFMLLRYGMVCYHKNIYSINIYNNAITIFIMLLPVPSLPNS